MQNGYKKISEATIEFKSFRGRGQRKKGGRDMRRESLSCRCGTTTQAARVVGLSQVSGPSQGEYRIPCRVRCMHPTEVLPGNQKSAGLTVAL